MFTVKELMCALRGGPFTSVGSYPTYFITSNGESLCHACVRSELGQVARATRDHTRDGWAVHGHDVNWEDASLYCGHCNERIDSAYAD